ncbi:MAG TPA: XRE family transcriptional regulator [Holophaga sp.]|nr:XRE family transcriptional regulator [Holophaga sp.]
MPQAQELGNRIRTYRERLGLAREELAANAGVDPALVEAAEEGRTYPGLGTMVRLSRALGQRLGTFMDDHFREDPLVVRAEERREAGEGHPGAHGPYAYHSLGRGKTDRHMEPFFVVVDPGPEGNPSSHEGEEFFLVLTGEVEFRYGGALHRLGPGDSIYYNSVVPHFVRALGEAPATLCAVVYQPL